MYSRANSGLVLPDMPSSDQKSRGVPPLDAANHQGAGAGRADRSRVEAPSGHDPLEPPEDAEQQPGVHRLDEEEVDPGLPRPPPVRLPAVPGHGDEEGRLAATPLPHP